LLAPLLLPPVPLSALLQLLLKNLRMPLWLQ